MGPSRDADRRLQHALEALKDSRARLQAALDAAQIGTWRWNVATDTFECDENLLRLLGLQTDQTPTSHEAFIALVHADDREKVSAARRRSTPDGPTTIEYRRLWPDGSEHWISERAGAIAGAGVPSVDITGACVDITSQKAAERVLRDTEARKDELLAMLVHELRDPAAPIHTGVETLRRLSSAGGAAAADAHATVERQIAHLVRLAGDLLEMSRIANGTLTLRRERCNLGRIVRQTVDDYRPIFRDRGIVVTMSVATADLWIDGDAARLAQIVSNVLHNASKFTPAGGWVTVTLSRESPSRAVSVRIADTGVGVDAELLARMFVPFAQAVQRDDRLPGGLGLGLAVVRGLMDMHGGTVEATSGGAGAGPVVTLRSPPAADAGERPPRRQGTASRS